MKNGFVIDLSKALVFATALFIGPAVQAQSGALARQPTSLEPAPQADMRIVYVGADKQPVTVTIRPRGMSPSNPGTVTPNQVIGGGCDEDNTCAGGYEFSWTYEYYVGGGGATANTTLDTVVVTGTNGCWITINGVDIKVDFCDPTTLHRVPDGDPAAPLNNLTPTGQTQLSGLLDALLPVKVLKCVVASADSLDSDPLYLIATQSAKTQLAGMQYKRGDFVDVLYRNGTTFTFTITGDIFGGQWSLAGPKVSLRNNTQCRQ